jgi:hypothetical protein
MNPADKKFIIGLGAIIVVVVLVAVLGSTGQLGYPN